MRALSSSIHEGMQEQDYFQPTQLLGLNNDGDLVIGMFGEKRADPKDYFVGIVDPFDENIRSFSNAFQSDWDFIGEIPGRKLSGTESPTILPTTLPIPAPTSLPIPAPTELPVPVPTSLPSHRLQRVPCLLRLNYIACK